MTDQRTEPDPLYDAVAATYDHDHYGLIAAGRNQSATQLHDLPFRGRTALDIGCGTGTFLAELHEAYPDCLLWGIDPSTAMLEVAASKVPATLLPGTIDDVVPAEKFDLISFHFVLAYESIEKLLDYCAEHLEPSGVVAIATTTMDNIPASAAACDFVDQSVLDEHFRIPASRDELRARIEAHGAFRVVDYRSHIRELEFTDTDAIREFVFESNWFRGFADAFRDEFEATLAVVPLPHRDLFQSHALLLSRRSAH